MWVFFSSLGKTVVILLVYDKEYSSLESGYFRESCEYNNRSIKCYIHWGKEVQYIEAVSFD